MRVVAILATYNEERFISGCLEHLIRHGVGVYVIDNSSTDQTVAIASRYLQRGVIGIETLDRSGVFRLRQLLERKERLASTLDADWLMHVDADEVHLAPLPGETLAQALARVDAEGYNAVNFLEFTFVPVAESPDHDHPGFRETMRWYYPFAPGFPRRLNAWKRQDAVVELAWSGGHVVRFPGLAMYPQSFHMKHYLFLSIPHAIRKYVEVRHAPEEIQAGWHRWRATLRPERIRLPSRAELTEFVSDDLLDTRNARARHVLDATERA